MHGQPDGGSIEERHGVCHFSGDGDDRERSRSRRFSRVQIGGGEHDDSYWDLRAMTGASRWP